MKGVDGFVNATEFSEKTRIDFTVFNVDSSVRLSLGVKLKERCGCGFNRSVRLIGPYTPLTIMYY